MAIINGKLSWIAFLATLILQVESLDDQPLSLSMVEKIDRHLRRPRQAKNEEDAVSFLDDHGHEGNEDPRLIGSSRYTNEWVVEITGGKKAASNLAEDMGYEIIAEVPNFPNLYRLHKLNHPRQEKTHSHGLTRQLADDVRVMWAEQQFGKLRQKRDFLPADSWLEAEQLNLPEEDRPLVRVKRQDESENVPRLKRDDMKAPPKRKFRFNDELWESQWYMHDTRTLSSLPRLDLNVLPVYDSGFTGRGVNVVILDDGLELNHTDLLKNYVPEISYDINDDDPDPTPRYGRGLRNSHGTRCAGEIAMEANNEKCGVGVAFNAGIGGIRMLDGTVTDRVEATALIHALEKVDIYSASWGPSDDGRTVEGPGRLTRQSLYRGITEGRQGKGVIYIWAAGNGGRHRDNCNCDGYVSSIYTLAIGSVSEHGSFPWYGEKCASVLAVAYSSGAYTDQKIATVDLGNKCTTDHTGTSAAAPLAAGIVALALEANPSLTWRDVQHLTVWTSEYNALKDNLGWNENAAGLRFNIRFGFGLVNGAKFVETAVNWTTVPAKSICVIPAINQNPVALNNTVEASVEFQSDGCVATSDEVNYLEHVEVLLTIEYPVRGNLEIDLFSPAGTRTQVLQPRPKDVSSLGFSNWAFVSVHTWGEAPHGQWKLIVTDMLASGNSTQSLTGRVVNATLVLHGTSAQPDYRKKGARLYDDNFNKLAKSNIDWDEDNQVVDVHQLRAKNPTVSWNDLIGLKLFRRSVRSN